MVQELCWYTITEEITVYQSRQCTQQHDPIFFHDILYEGNEDILLHLLWKVLHTLPGCQFLLAGLWHQVSIHKIMFDYQYSIENTHNRNRLRGKDKHSTWAMLLDKSCKECAASKDSKNEASSGFSVALTCTWRTAITLVLWNQFK